MECHGIRWQCVHSYDGLFLHVSSHLILHLLNSATKYCSPVEPISHHSITDLLVIPIAPYALEPRIVSEMEADQKRHEKKKEQTRPITSRQVAKSWQVMTSPQVMRSAWAQQVISWFQACYAEGLRAECRGGNPKWHSNRVTACYGLACARVVSLLSEQDFTQPVQSRPFITDMVLFSETSDAQVLSKSLPRPSQVLPSLRFPPHARESRPQMAEHCRVRCSWSTYINLGASDPVVWAQVRAVPVQIGENRPTITNERSKNKQTQNEIIEILYRYIWYIWYV